MYLLDTNVVSELRKVGGGNAHPGISRWEATVSTIDLFLSVIVLQELEVGVLRLERRDPVQGTVLRQWLDGYVKVEFRHRMLDVDAAVALRSAQLQATRSRAPLDSLIAATAFRHNMTVVTRNVSDFSDSGIRVFNPWETL